MSLPNYSDYQESGLDWLGEIPKAWTLKRLGHFFNERREKVSDKDFQPLSVTKLGIVPRLETAAKTQDGDNRKRVVAGDYVINSRSDRKGSSGLSEFDGSVSLICIVLEPTEIEGRFAHHLFRSEVFQEEFYRNGKGIVADLWSTGFSEMKSIAIPVPSRPEQTQIARFLDHETAKIDALIREQERLIALLQEKRQAVISHAVTKGLDPNVPMKDSGVEWLGEVPAHWIMTRAKIVADVFVPQRNKPDLNDSGAGYYWVTMEDMKTGQIKSTRHCVSEAALSEAGSKVLKKGAVIASCVGNFGVASLLCVDAVINQQLQAYIPKRVSGRYLRDLITCSKTYFDLVGTAATLVYVNQEGFANLPVPLPPEHEQQAIEFHVEKSKIMFDRALMESRKLIAILQERRSALISAAVTGKIDVRNWQPPADESAFGESVHQAGMETTA